MKKANSDDLEERLNEGKNQTTRNQPDDKGEDQMQIDPNNYDLSAALHPISCVITFAFKGLAIFGYPILHA